jgi:hypothetical protein
MLGKPQEASQKLRAAGIPGIKYFDAGSRGDADKPTRNYVVFDDKLVNVRRRYEQGGAVDAEHMATGGEVGDDAPYHQTPEFQNWFGDSVAHMDGVPVTYYHGTSKDKDFPSFNVGRHGVWLTSDPEEASQYAEQNDSQNYTYEGVNNGASEIGGDYYQVGVSAPFGKFDVGANYIYDDSDLFEGTSYQLGGGYNFSKRTRLYAFYDFKEQDFGSGVDAKFETNVFAIGVRHNF